MSAVVKEREASLTAARLRELLDYNPETGVFWRKKNSGKRWGGTIAGASFQNGYRFIRIDDGRFLSHRLAWLYVHGKWPENEIDHINGDKSDNRIVNLRSVTIQQNRWNSAVRAQSASGHRHIRAHHRKFQVQILRGVERIFHKSFPSLETAIIARDAELSRLRGEYRPTTERRA